MTTVVSLACREHANALSDAVSDEPVVPKETSVMQIRCYIQQAKAVKFNIKPVRKVCHAHWIL